VQVTVAVVPGSGAEGVTETETTGVVLPPPNPIAVARTGDKSEIAAAAYTSGVVLMTRQFCKSQTANRTRGESSSGSCVSTPRILHTL
jgi:hypothetical protein